MDNNSQVPQQPAAPITPAAPNAATVAPAVPPIQPQNTAPVTPQPSGNKMVLWFIVGLVAVVLIVGGIYFFLSSQQSKDVAKMPVQKPVVQAESTPAETIDALERDLESVNSTDVDTDFVPVDQDLQQL